MANAARVVQVWSERTDTSSSRADAVFRALQRGGMIQKSGKGGGRNAYQWEASPLVSHAIGIAVAETATNASDLVPQYRALRFFQCVVEQAVRKNGEVVEYTRQTSPQRYKPAANSLTAYVVHFGHDYLGDCLDALVNDAACLPGAREAIRSSGLLVILARGRPTASIYFTTPEGHRVTESYVMSDQPTLPGVQFDTGYWAPEASVQVTARLPFTTIEMLADLLRDTLDHKGAALPLPAPDDPEARNENAALAGAAPSSITPPNEPTRAHTAQQSSLNNCDHTARVCVPSRGIDSGAVQPLTRKPSHERAHHHAAA